MNPSGPEYDSFHDDYYDYDADDFDGADDYLRYYDPNIALSRKSLQYVVLSILVIAATILFQLLRYYNYRVNSPFDLLWDAVVFLTPARVLEALENWLHPPIVPRPMYMTQARSHAAKSDLLRKILGLDKLGTTQNRGGVLNNAARNLLLKKDGNRPPGLGNWDNSCYQNSILQGLASLPPLPEYLNATLQESSLGHVDANTTETLRDLIAGLNDTSNNGTTLWTPAKLKNMSTWQQQDAQEYFSKLLDDVDREVAKAAKAAGRTAGLEPECGTDETAASQHSDDSGYHSLSSTPRNVLEAKSRRNPLEGLVAQRVACVSCRHSDGLSMIPFNCLTLNLDVNKLEYNLFERLDAYTRVESIEGVECGKCTLLKMKRLLPLLLKQLQSTGADSAKVQSVFSKLEAVELALEEEDFEDKTLRQKCNIPAPNMVSSTKTKQAVVARAPQSLAIHINRSVFDETTGHMFKNLGALRFPSMLDLGPWCLGSAEGAPEGVVAWAQDAAADGARAKADAPRGGAEEQWLLDPRASMSAGGERPSKISGPIYELRAVVTHVGRHETGHYICYRKLPRASPPPPEPVAKKEPEEEGSEAEDVDVEDARGLDTVDGIKADAGSDAEGSSESSDESSDEDESETTEEDASEPEMDWWRLSDESVWQVEEETVLDQGGVFMLFYDCVDPYPALASTLKDALDDVPERREQEVSQSPKLSVAVSPPKEGKSSKPEDALGETLRLAAAIPLPEDDQDGWVSHEKAPLPAA